MDLGRWLFELVCIAGIILSLKSVAVLGRRSPYTIAGWVFTAAYFALAGYDAWHRATAPLHVDYVLVAALTIVFVVAGRRNEPQAEPWWWPAPARV
jgi:hypothetical protein